MMLFLIEYDRERGQVITIRRFEDLERQTAERARLDMEVRLNRMTVDREVVLLEANSEAALRQTHARYFENLSELVKAS